jgi:dihydrofolate reductase
MVQNASGTRRLVVIEYVSLDGVIEDPGGSEGKPYGGWTRPYWGDDIGQSQLERLFASDALLLGRVTYEGFAAAWPKMKDEAGFADRMNSMPKYVVSTTLENPEWNNSRVIKANVAEEIAALKRQPGQDILVYGSGTLVQTLLRHGLVDELRLLVYPVVLGAGKRLFHDGTSATLQPVETRTLGSGVVLATYRPAQKKEA